MAKWVSVVGLFAVVSGSLMWIYFKQNSQNRSRKRRKNSVTSGSLGASEVFVEDSEDNISVEHAKALTLVLGNESCTEDLKRRALITIAKKAAFTKNHVILRETGCLRALSCLVQSLELRHKAEKDLSSADLIEAALIAINNLANSEENQCHLKDCIGSLFVFVSSDRHMPEKVRIASLRCLVNFTCTDTCIENFLQFDIQVLFDLTDSQTTSSELRIMSLKLLANLSSQRSMAVHLLAATVSLSFFREFCSSSDIALRWLTVLRNLTLTMNISQLTHQKCSSGRMRLAKIFGDVGERRLLHVKLVELSTDSDSDIKQLALQLLTNLSTTTTDAYYS